MSNYPDTVLVMPGNAATGGMPYVTKPENIDTWPNAAATETAAATIAAIIGRGFTGIQIETAELSRGRMFSNFCFDTRTPEGRVGGNVLRLARDGRLVPVTQAIEAIERLYREESLPIPKKQKPQRANAEVSIES